MANILFYTSISSRIRDQESLMREFVKQGHNVFFVNQRTNQYLPGICRAAGVSYETTPAPIKKNVWLRTLFFCQHLIRFARRKKIEVIYSHLEPANFIAVLVQWFVKAKVIIVRHHHDLAAIAGFDRDRSYRLTYTLAKEIITVSQATKNYMVSNEGVNPAKITAINLGYDFSLFEQPDAQQVNQLRRKTKGGVVLTTVGRLDPYKRPDVSLRIIKLLKDHGIDSHLFLLGDGAMRSELLNFISENELTSSVTMVGYVDNVADYICASDWVLHPSISESSCVVAKEAGLLGVPVIVCKGVGDFDEYLIDNHNSRLVSRDHFVSEAVKIMLELRLDQEHRELLGKNLKETVIKRFSIYGLVQEYNRFHPSVGHEE